MHFPHLADSKVTYSHFITFFVCLTTSSFIFAYCHELQVNLITPTQFLYLWLKLVLLHLLNRIIFYVRVFCMVSFVFCDIATITKLWISHFLFIFPGELKLLTSGQVLEFREGIVKAGVLLLIVYYGKCYAKYL